MRLLFRVYLKKENIQFLHWQIGETNDFQVLDSPQGLNSAQNNYIDGALMVEANTNQTCLNSQLSVGKLQPATNFHTLLTQFQFHQFITYT